MIGLSPSGVVCGEVSWAEALVGDDIALQSLTIGLQEWMGTESFFQIVQSIQIISIQPYEFIILVNEITHLHAFSDGQSTRDANWAENLIQFV